MSNTQTPQRAYRGKSAAMLVGIATIAENALHHQVALQDADSTFTADYFRDLRTRIDVAAREVLGADNAAALRKASIDVRDIAGQAVKELGLTKTWIESKFATDPVRRDDLLNNLGFKRFYTTAVGKRQQEDIGQLLERVSASLDRELSMEFASAGLPQTRITAIHELAASFSAKNVHQEAKKSQRSERTAGDISKLNALYTEVIGVSKIARVLFRDQPSIQGSFVFENVAPAGRSRKSDPPGLEVQ